MENETREEMIEFLKELFEINAQAMMDMMMEAAIASGDHKLAALLSLMAGIYGDDDKTFHKFSNLVNPLIRERLEDMKNEDETQVLTKVNLN